MNYTTAASRDEATPPRAASRPSSFTQLLQSHVVDVAQSSQLVDICGDDVDDSAPDARPTRIADASEAMSSGLHLTSSGHSQNAGGVSVDDDRCVAASSPVADVSDVAPDARSADVTPTLPPTSSSPPGADVAGRLAPQTQHDPTSALVSPLSSLLSGEDTEAGRKSTATLRSGDGDDDGRRPLSSGWATALAAASIAGKVAAASATKRRPNAAKPGGASSNIRASRSLYCLTTSNPIRKLSISVVEWKYPLRSPLLSAVSAAIML